MKLRYGLVCALVCGVSVALADSGTWTGSAGNVWTQDANWGGSPYPQGDETAMFGAAGAGTVDVSGLSGIQSLYFSGSAFTLGTGGQSLTWWNGGTLTLAGGSAAQTIGASVTLGQNADAAGFIIQNNSANALLFADNVTAAQGNAKTLTLRGSGPVEIAGTLDRGSASGLDVVMEGTGTVKLSGNNNLVRQINMNGPAGGVLDIGSGSLRFENGGSVNLRSQNSATINGTGAMTFSGGSGDDHADNGAVRTDAVLTINVKLTGPAGFEYWVGSNDAAGMVVFNGTNDFQGTIALNSAGTISANIIGNQGSTTSNLGQGSKILFNGNGVGSGLRYTGTGETTDRLMQIPKSARFDMSGTGRLIFATPFAISGGANTLYLSGSTSGIAEIAEGLSNGSGAYSIQKSGSGMWVLSGVNTFSGALAVTGGTLALANVNAVGGVVSVSNGGTLLLEDAGQALNVSGFTLSGGGALSINNTAAANVANRVSASATLEMTMGTLAVTHDAAAATDYSAAVGMVTVNAGGFSTVQTMPAAAGQTSALYLGGLINSGGSINFVGDDLGMGDENRIFITGMPDGLIGPWAIVNGTSMAAYDSARGVYASSDTTFTYVDIAAWGDTIPDASTDNVRIATHGTGAELQLASTVTSVARLLHDTDTNAVAVTAGKTLQTSSVRLNTGAWPLTLGEAAGDGTLTALPNGTMLALDNDSASLLHINAAITDNGVPLALVKQGLGPVRLSGALEHTGGTLLIGGGLEIDVADYFALDTLVSGLGDWAKVGPGTLRLNAENTFQGTLTIREGTVIPGNNQALGNPVGTVVIEDGAALDLSNGMAQNTMTLNKSFVISGFGPDNLGAVVNFDNTQFNAFGKIRLAADTGFGGPIRWDMRSNGPTLSLDGYTLHKLSGNEIALVSVTVNPDRQNGTKGDIIIEQGTFTLEGNTAMNGDSGNTVTVRAGATLHFWAHNTPSHWSLIMEDGAYFGAGSGGGATQNVWRGPFEIWGNAWFNRGATKTIESGITGSGSFGHLDGFTYLRGTNTYTGTTTVSNGVLHAVTHHALPNWDVPGYVTGVAGQMVLHAADDGYGWTKAQIMQYKDTATMTVPHWLCVDTTQLSLTLDDKIDGTFSFAKHGAGYLVLEGGLDITGLLSVVGARDSVLTLAAGNDHFCTGINVTGQADPATLNVDGPVYMDKTTLNQHIYVSNNANGRSYMNINADIETGGFFMGSASNTFAAVVQNSGRVQTALGNGGVEVFSVGANNFGYGYYRMNGGTNETGQLSVTGNNTGSGVLDIFGGEISVMFGWLLTCWGGGNGVITLHGGKLGSYPEYNQGVNLTDAGDRGSFSMLNMLGADTVLDLGQVRYGVDLAKLGGNSLSALNLNAGTMIAQRIFARSPDTPTFLNFDGGTLEASVNGMLLNGSITAATLYDGGATIDTSEHYVTVAQPLLAPTDYGVSAVALDNAGVNYMGPPIVKLSGGSGTGAMAIATLDFDANSSDFGKLTGLTVTAPGTGYLESDTLTATLVSGGGTTAASAGEISLAPHAQTGGLTKLGTGTLALNAPCTYKGVTHIKEGTLRLTSENAGLYEGSVGNAGTSNMNTAEASPQTSIVSDIRMAQTGSGWPNYTTYIYTGYVWNRTGANATWTFAKSFDDAIYLVIDGNVVMNHGQWDVIAIASYTLTPGAHTFEVRFGQGGGGVGPVQRDWWNTTTMGFGYDPLGRNSETLANYQPMIDPGDGSLFTLTATSDPIDMIPHSSCVIVDAGATLDLGGGINSVQRLSGDGRVINGTLVLTDDLMPGGNGAIGTLTFETDLAVTATYYVDTLPSGESDLVAVNGNVNLSQMTLTVVDPLQLSKGKSHTILTAAGTITGDFTVNNLPAMWQVRRLPTSVKIVPASGTLIILR